MKRTARSTVLRRRRPMVRQLDVPVVGLDPRLAGVRLAHLSDVHVSALAQPRLLWRAVERVAQSGAELVLLTGDYVCASLKALPRLTEALRAIAVPSIATLGNHDHWAGASEVAAALTAAGVRVLQNQHLTLELRGAPLHVIGLDDGTTRHADPVRAFEGVPDAGFRVALTHDPRQADRVAPRGADLILAGHTHGGQIDVPGLTRRLMRRRGFHYLGGEYRVGSSLLYVSRGLGASIPLRVRAPSEVAVLTLRVAPARG
ncbi:MAG TPA: metallophosphoesterase [Myxococcales bacterium]|nr:metallophosphoesterase [Myxococcales bacterium]